MRITSITHRRDIRSVTGEELDLWYFLEWRPRLWSRPVLWLIGNPARFKDKHILEFDCRHGRMSCMFGLFGATVRGVDLDSTAIEFASAEAERWQVQDRVVFEHYDGNPNNITGEDYDFVFTKSVLVVIQNLLDFLSQLSKKVKVGGEFLAAENLEGNSLLRFIRRNIIHYRWDTFEESFSGVND